MKWVNSATGPDERDEPGYRSPRSGHGKYGPKGGKRINGRAYERKDDYETLFGPWNVE